MVFLTNFTMAEIVELMIKFDFLTAKMKEAKKKLTRTDWMFAVAFSGSYYAEQSG